MQLSFDEILAQIKEKNYAVLPNSVPAEDIEDAVASFFAFLKLPQETKDKFRHMLDVKNHGSEVGYAKKFKTEGALDNKEFFHYNLYTEDVFKNIPERNLPEVERFFASAGKVYEAAARATTELLDVFEEKFPGIKDKFFPASGHPFFYLRFLKYDTTPKGEFLAKGHYDRGTMTIAIAESAPGLRIGKNESDLKEADRSAGVMVFMPAYRFQDITSPEFTPAWHDVIQKSDDLYSTDAARWAVVFFADTVEQNHIDWNEVHTPK